VEAQSAEKRCREPAESDVKRRYASEPLGEGPALPGSYHIDNTVQRGQKQVFERAETKHGLHVKKQKVGIIYHRVAVD